MQLLIYFPKNIINLANKEQIVTIFKTKEYFLTLYDLKY